MSTPSMSAGIESKRASLFLSGLSNRGYDDVHGQYETNSVFSASSIIVAAVETWSAEYRFAHVEAFRFKKRIGHAAAIMRLSTLPVCF
jgi:hypothetical protein